MPPSSELASGGKLLPGEYLLSPDRLYELVMQGDGNLVLYHEGTAVWATYTSGSENYVTMQPEGNLVVYHGGEAQWSTSTWGFSGAFLRLQDDGNLVVYQEGHAIWTYGSGYKGHVMNQGESLNPGAYLLSPDHEYELIMQGDGNLVLYHGGSALWSAATSQPGNYATMQTDGNFAIYGEGAARWSSASWGFPGAYLQLQDDGNLVIYQNGHAVWSYGSGYKGHILNPGEVLQPGAYLLSPDHEYELIMQGDGNLVLYHGGSALWSAATSQPGDYAAMQTDGNLVVYSGATALWNSQTSGYAGAFAQLQDDSNFVLYLGGTPLWDRLSGKLVSGGGGGGGASVGQQIVASARKWLGYHYCWDGGGITGPSHADGDLGGKAPDCASGTTVGFDCGGLVQYAVYSATGGAVLMPHEQNGAYQRFASSRVSEVSLNESAWQAGDVIVFDTGDHVGIYVGGGRMIDADTPYYLRADGVQEEPVSWLTNALSITRVLRAS